MRVRSRFASPSFSCLALSSVFLLAPLVYGRAVWAQDAGPKIDHGSQRSYPAGPYSSVSTAHGGLDTVIPLFSLEGANGSGLSFAIRHRSNQEPGTSYIPVSGGAGAGWVHTQQEDIGTGGNVSVFRFGNSAGDWFRTVIGGTQDTYQGRAGTRDLVTGFHTPGGSTTRMEVTRRGDRTRSIYETPAIANNYSILRLSAVEDTFGNRVQYSYQPDTFGVNFPTGATAVGTGRSYSLGYTLIDNKRVFSSVTLTTASGSRTWSWDFYPGVQGQVRRVYFPDPTGGSNRPFVEFFYNSEGNIIDLYDMKRNRWHYDYAATGGPRPNKIACKAVYKPQPGNPALSDPYPVRFSWVLANILGDTVPEQVCEISEPYGNTANPPYRLRKHIYDNGGGNFPYFYNPIRRVQDPYVAQDNVNYWETFDWDYANAVITRYADRRGKQTNYTYDTTNKGQVRTVTDALGWVTNFLWNDDLLVTEVVPTGTNQQSRTVHTYNTTTRKRIKTVVDPASDPNDPGYTRNPAIALTTNYTYIPAGQSGAGELASSWSGTESPVWFENYDAYGNARTLKSAAGYVTTLTFDAWNNKLTEAPPSPLSPVNYTYDQWNRPTGVSTASGAGGAYVTATTQFDLNGNVWRTEDGNTDSGVRNWTQFYFDALNRTTYSVRPTTLNDADNLSTFYTYDAAGRQTVVTNPKGKTTAYQYDERDAVRQVTYPDNTTRRSKPDGNGNVVETINGRGQVTTYQYSDRNELTFVNRPDGETVTNLYRADGARYQTTDYYPSAGSRISTWAFDNARRVVSHYQPVPNKTVNYFYKPSGRMDRMEVGDIQWTYNYDAANQLNQLWERLGSSGTPIMINFGYHASGALYVRDLPNGTSTFFGYDGVGRTNYIGHWDWDTAMANRTEEQKIVYSYDNAGNVTSYMDQTNLFGLWNFNYYYDRANRLVWEARNNGLPNTQYDTGYAYDKNGNRTGTSRGGIYSGYTVDNNDRLLSGDGYTFGTYDNDGNPASVTTPNGNTMTLTFDPANRLRQANQSYGSLTTSYWYNGDGKRFERNDFSPATGTVTTRYVFDLSGNVIAETNGSNVITRYHVPGIRFTESNGKRYYYRENGLGSQLALTGDRGSAPGQGNNSNIASRTEYDGFGMENDLTSPSDKRGDFRFAGKHGYITDVQTGMQLLGARYYLPALGRFLTQDPIGHQGGLNLYAYCNNNPLAKVDPDGFQGIYVPIAPNEARANMRNNVRTAERMKKHFEFPPQFMARYGLAHVDMYKAKLEWFRTQVQQDGPWDFNTSAPGRGNDREQFEEYGNFHYGVVGAAAGIGLEVLLRAAGRAQENDNFGFDPRNGHWWEDAPYGDDPHDQQMITNGYRYYQEHYAKKKP